jgi:hypothetical protein
LEDAIMVDFTNRITSSIGDVISELVDDALVAHTKAEYEKGRGSGQGEIAAKRIGAAYAGTECMRALAFRYHKFPREDREGPVNKGELQRHADAGHWTEDKTAEWMRFADFVILSNKGDGEQFGWHAARNPETGQYRMAGEVDGVITVVPDRLKGLIRIPCIWESKKATDKKWTKFSKDKVSKADPVYYGQVQLNMAYLNVEQTLFSMLNLDTMKYYWELIDFDQKHAQRISDRALEVIQSQTPEQFARLGRSEDDFVCKFCDYHDRCWHPEQYVDSVVPLLNFSSPPKHPTFNPNWKP